MTRAKQSLVLSRAVYRRSYGEERLRASLPSRFLAEIPARSDRSCRSDRNPNRAKRDATSPIRNFRKIICLPPNDSHSLWPSHSRSAASRRLERSSDRHARAPFQIRHRHDHRSRRRRRRSQVSPLASRITAQRSSSNATPICSSHEAPFHKSSACDTNRLGRTRSAVG